MKVCSIFFILEIKLTRKQVPAYLFNKNKKQSYFSANVYCDYDEFLTIYKIIETTRNKEELKFALEKINKIFKGLMFSNKPYLKR